VHAHGVSKSYREAGSEARVLHGVALALARGETTSLVGRSGSGKSTLIALLAGLLLPDAGTLCFDGRDMSALDDGERARLRAERIGVVLQRDNLIPFLTASENVELAMGIAGARRARERARDLLGELGLARRIHYRPSALSGGEAQRVAVAVALANTPDLLLADEVTGELDSASAEQVMDVILGAWREHGLSVLYVTHSDELAGRAQRRLALANGAVHAL
jgi:predicted ABC-type transport system involved in lysophospholipase L1 biosynthesis ATPase subunit